MYIGDQFFRSSPGSGYFGVIGVLLGLPWGYEGVNIGIMEKKMENYYLVFRVEGQGFRA